MTIIEATITNVDVDTRVRVRTDSQGRKRTTQKRTYTLNLDDGSTALYQGDGSFKKKDKLLLVSKERKDGKKLITAYHNLSQNLQGPTQQELRGTFGLGSFLIIPGFFILFIGAREYTGPALIVGLAFILYAIYFMQPALSSARALRRINKYQSAK